MHLCAAASAGDLMACAGLRDEHRRLHIDAIDLIELFFADIGQQLFALDSDAIDQQIEPAVLGVCPINRRAHRLQVFGVGDRHVSAQPGIADRRGSTSRPCPRCVRR